MGPEGDVGIRNSAGQWLVQVLWSPSDLAQNPDSAPSWFPFIAKPQFLICKMGLTMVLILQVCCEDS